MSGLENFKDKLQNRAPVFGSTFSAINSIHLPRVFKSAGVDFMLFDCEHGNYAPEGFVDMLTMCRLLDLPSVIRVQDCEYHCISKCLDLGADAVLIPRTETLAQVELAVASVRFYPRGRKGAGGVGLLRPGESAEDFNENRLLFLQIESPLGVRSLDEMLETYGAEIAGVIIGPSDLSITSGMGLQTNSEPVLRQIREIIAICQGHEKSVGMFLMPSQLAAWAGEGMNILWCSSDTGFMAQGLRQTLDEVAKL